MFLGGLDRERVGLPSRVAGIGLGTILMLAAAAALFAPRSTAFSFPICVAAFLLVACLRQDLHLRDALPGRATWGLAAFYLFALLSSLWARNPGVPFEKASLALLGLAGAIAVTSLIARESHDDALHMGEGICIGFAVGLLFLLIEVLTAQGLKIAFFNALHFRPGELKPPAFFQWKGGEVVSMSIDYLSRSITPIALFLWPTALILRVVRQATWRLAITAAFVAISAAVILLASHESSKLALVAGSAVFVLALLSRRWAYRVMVLAWVIACLAIVPLAILAYRLDLHQSKWLQMSARHRVVIWNETAEKTLEAPFVGVGANMTYVLGPERERENPAIHDEELPRTLNMHSHNIYLQTWFELGAVGALLLTLAGLSLLASIATLSSALQPYAYATFASVGAMAAASYGMWQIWYLALFAFTAIALAVGARLASSASPQHDRRSPGML